MGPRVLTLEAHQRLLKKDRMIELGVGRYCVVRNPVERGPDGQVLLDAHGQARLAVGDREVRVGPLPFVLYPGEDLEAWRATRLRSERPECRRDSRVPAVAEPQNDGS